MCAGVLIIRSPLDLMVCIACMFNVILHVPVRAHQCVHEKIKKVSIVTRTHALIAWTPLYS
jgi:hypothetical protein